LDSTASAIIKRLDQLKSTRSNWDDHFQEVADFVLPRKNNILNKKYPGERRNLQVYDSTAIHASELLGGALHGLMTNPSSIFFELTTGVLEIDDMDDVRLWLQKATRQMHEILNNSNFQTAIHEVYMDQVVFGTGVLFMEEDEDSIISFNSRPISEVYVDENNKDKIDVVFREYEYDTRQLIQEYGEEEISRCLGENNIKNQMDKKHKVINAIFPRSDAKHYTLGSKAMPFASVWVLVDKKKVLKEGGYRVFPAAIPRWVKASGEIYGRSPAMKALPDIKMLNQMKVTTIKGAQKTVDPPILVPDDGYLNPPNMVPGGLNFYRAGSPDKIQPFSTNSRIDFGIELIKQTAQQIREAFFIDQLQLAQAGPQMTATEVVQRTEQAMRLLGPILGRQQNELLRPIIDRMFDIMERRGALPDNIPDVLRGREIRVQYSSLISRAQRASEAQNILRTLEAATPFINANPELMDNFDGDKAVRYISRLFSMPQEIIVNKRDMERIRKQRAAAQQAAMQQQAQSQGAQDVNQLAQAANQAGLT
jgi:hypothetical protein